MKQNILWSLGLVTCITLGFHLGKNSTSESISHNEAQNSNKREIASIKTTSPTKKNKGIANDWTKITKTPKAQIIFDKTLMAFKDSKYARDFATICALRTKFDSSREYGIVLNRALENMNAHPNEFDKFASIVHSLSAEDTFIRTTAINVVNLMDIDAKKKVDFFTTEGSRTVSLDSNGKFSKASFNITTSLIFLKKNMLSKSDVQKVIQRSYENNPSPLAKRELDIRFKTYFPSEFKIYKDLN